MNTDKGVQDMGTRPLTGKQKTTMAVYTGWITFSLGWFLTVVNFFAPPLGEVADSTLWILGQALLYVGAVIGISTYARHEIHSIRREVGIETEDDET